MARLESSKLSHRDARTGAGIAAAIVVVGFGLLWSLISGDANKLDEKMEKAFKKANEKMDEKMEMAFKKADVKMELIKTEAKLGLTQ